MFSFLLLKKKEILIVRLSLPWNQLMYKDTARQGELQKLRK